MCLIVFRDDEAAASFLIETVNDAGPRHTADTAESAFAVMQQGIDERVFFIARRRVNDDSRSLVQHEQRFILKHNFERDGFGFCFGRFGFRDFDADNLSRARRVRGFGGFAVDRDMTFINQPLNRAARQSRERQSQKRVQPHSGMRTFDGVDFNVGSHQFESCTN